ncbi:MAG: hypothetical protein R6V12_17185, partial [Candidatus Hydrogenedentota bacterium]
GARWGRHRRAAGADPAGQAFLPGVLEHYDLPELIAVLDMPVLLANPLDARGVALEADAAAAVFQDATEVNPGCTVAPGESVRPAEAFVKRVLLR